MFFDAGIISFFHCYQIVYFRFFGRFLDLECMFVRKFSLRMRYGLIAGLLVCVCGFSLLTDLAMYEKRIQEIEAEIQSVRSGEYRGQRLFPGLLLFGRAFAIWMNSRYGD